MQVISHDNAESLLERCRSTLLTSPILNHNVIQIASILCGDNDFYQPPFWFCTVEDNGRVLGAAVYAAPDGLVLSEMPEEAMKLLCQRLVEEVPCPERVIGEPRLTQQAASQLAEMSGLYPTLSTEWHVAHLTSVRHPIRRSSGDLRIGKNADKDLVARWGKEYGREKPSFLDVSDYMVKKLQNGDLYIWEDDYPTTIVTVSGRSDDGVRISSVFTPPRHRNLGYASSAVATLSESLLSAGHQFVVLTWRVGDPVGRIYEKLGFEVVGTQMSYVNQERPAKSA